MKNDEYVVIVENGPMFPYKAIDPMLEMVNRVGICFEGKRVTFINRSTGKVNIYKMDRGENVYEYYLTGGIKKIR